MEIKIISDQSNKLLRRREIAFEVRHPGSPSPTRAEVRKELASLLGKDQELVYIIKMITKTGTHLTYCEAEVYNTIENAVAILPRHIIERHKKTK